MSISRNLKAINDRINEAARKAGRDASCVKLVAVSKTKPSEMIREALDSGQVIFGENYIQEAKDKVPALGDGPQWHFIGHLQSNKANIAAELFQVIETVDRLKLAKALNRKAAELGKKLTVLLQVNVGKEPQKAGCEASQAASLAQEVANLENLHLAGLMTMPPFFDQPEKARPYFRELRKLAECLAPDLPPGSMNELSMGMSGDFEEAIKEGATLVRVGTAIFGAREYN